MGNKPARVHYVRDASDFVTRCRLVVRGGIVATYVPADVTCGTCRKHIERSADVPNNR